MYRHTKKRLKTRKVPKGKDRVKDYAISAGRGALIGATADILNPLSMSGRHSLLYQAAGAGALAGVGYEAYKGMKKKAALENFYLVKEAGRIERIKKLLRFKSIKPAPLDPARKKALESDLAKKLKNPEAHGAEVKSLKDMLG